MREQFDQYARSYNQVLSQTLGTSEEEAAHFAEYKIELMRRNTEGRSVTNVLDFGCGPGRSLRPLAEKFARAQLFGFDPSPECAEIAKSVCPQATVVSSYRELPGASFDVILLANVLHHVRPDLRLTSLQDCAGLLAPRGCLFVFEHNPLNPVTRRVFERCPFDQDASMVPRGALLRLGSNAGLKITRSEYTLFFPEFLRAFRKWESRLGWLPLGAQYYVEFEK